MSVSQLRKTPLLSTSIQRVSPKGTSLVETLISIALLGTIMIPVLFISSANFLGQLANLRENIDAYQSTSYFLNKFIDTLQQSQRVLPDSTSTEIHLAYYDPILDREIKIGYRIQDMGSYRILHERQFNEATLTWGDISPYPLLEADEVTLPDTVTFDYCLDNTCSGNTDVSGEPERTTMVQLTGWSFTYGGQTANLPNMDIYASTAPSGGGNVILSDGIREIYSFPNSTSFGAGADLGMVNLTPDGNNFSYLNVVTGSGGVAGLTTILNGEIRPGKQAIGSDGNGRVFFGESQGNPGSFWTWHGDTGLSTILDGETKPGMSSMAVTASGRVFFGEANGGHMRTWHKDTGLSTVGNGTLPGVESTRVDSTDRVYFAEIGCDSSGRHTYTWHATTGLSTIIYNRNAGYASTRVADNGRAFFGGCRSDSYFYTYKPDTGLSTIITNSPTTYGYLGAPAMEINPSSGRVFFAAYNAPTPLFSWHNDTGLSTLASLSYPGSGDSQEGESQVVKAMAVDSNDRVFAGGEAGRMWTWHKDTGLSTLLTVTGGHSVGVRSTLVDSNDRVYFGEIDGGHAHDTSTKFWTWKASTGLSTLLSGIKMPGYDNVRLDQSGNVYIGAYESDGSNDHFWRWNETDGLSTISSGITNLQRDRLGFEQVNLGVLGAVSPNQYVMGGNNQIYFGETFTSADHFFSWSKDNGLSTILSGENNTSFNVRYDIGSGYVFFGEDSGGGSFWAYNSGDAGGGSTLSAGAKLARYGNKTGETIAFEDNSVGYISAFQDSIGDFYMVDGTNDKLDRYTYNGSSERFERASQKAIGTWAANVDAIAIDQASTGVALLVGSSDDVYTYTDRTATTGSATTQDISAVVTSATGLAVSGRTGNWLVIDSDVTGSGANKKIQLHVFKNDWTFKKSIDIKVNDTDFLSVDASSETNFKIQYDDESNILYLLAPSLEKTFALALPEKL